MAATPMAVPSKIVCLKSVYNEKFLRYKYEDIQTHGLLESAADQVMDPYAQFEIEKSQTYHDLVHIKSCYNNKYLVRWDSGRYWITASASKIDENQDKWSCTLFRPIYFDDQDTTKLRLQHVQLDHYVSIVYDVSTYFETCLFAWKDEFDEDSLDVFTLVNWESLFKIPDKVAFKGNNEKYLGIIEKNGINYLQFSYDSLDDPKVLQEIYENPDGIIFIKSNYCGKFWRLGEGDYIIADEDDPRDTENRAAMFRPAVFDVNVVALLNMEKAWLCKRYSIDSMENFMNAATRNVEGTAKLEVIDLVLKG